MSSEHKTEHFQLNQWVPEDPVLRADFNADNMKIDMALALLAGRKSVVTLFDTTTTEDVYKISLQFQDIVLSDYLFLFMSASFLSFTAEDIKVRVNDISASNTYVHSLPSSANYRDHLAMTFSSDPDEPNDCASGFMLFPCLTDRFMCFNAALRSKGTTPRYVLESGCSRTVRPEDVQTLDFIGYLRPFLAGTRIMIHGVKL
jgi:hypothetical protein